MFKYVAPVGTVAHLVHLTREYIDWIEEDVAVKGQRVFGIICLNDPTKDLIEKVKADDQMRLFEYSISYSEII